MQNIFFFQCGSGRNSVNQAICLVPEAREIFFDLARTQADLLQHLGLVFLREKNCHSPAKVGPYWENLRLLS